MRLGRGRPRGAAKQRARTGGGHQIPDLLLGKAYQAGYARYDHYCQNEAPDALRSKCEKAAKLGLSTCLNTTRDKGCESPCSNLQLTFQTFCRDYGKSDACWSASNEGYAACKAKGVDGLADPQISDPPVVTPGASTGAREIRQREVRWTCSDVARTSPSRPVRVAGDRWECGAGGAMAEGGGRHLRLGPST